ncbi:hypothetical protein FJV83_29595 [Mesorhizobium sp. WSM4307]|uniref:DUF6894 family protein n=2 Tax=Mesorhizobium TaxID=68287 RepID=UPI00115C709C|nr:MULTISPECIES: hypothetical protein [unclassified Mesorhizobium]TRC77986.1 hypothetical protein FJV81_10305 [Mesorhizobium sp. WSM4315]TRC78617.1 hypothetical protein FJV83_29595 [Mesorhizobium sp. WSM4307]
MQILETVVENGPFPTVRFLGEGGEAISVSLAYDNALDDVQLIAKAKVLLLHAATFDETSAADDARMRSQPESGRDASYILEYQDKGHVQELAGLSFPTLQAVLAECRRSAADLWQDALSRGEAPVGWAVRAKDASGAVVATVDYEDFRTSDADVTDVGEPNSSNS